MDSLYPYLWVLLAYCAIYLTAKYLYRWFIKDPESIVASVETAESPGNEA